MHHRPRHRVWRPLLDTSNIYDLGKNEELIGSTLEENLRLVARLEMIATRKGVMPCQLALAGAERQLELEEISRRRSCN